MPRFGSHANAPSRRRALQGLAGTAAALLWAHGVRAAATPIKIGIIGSGRIGGTLGELWVKAGHPVMFSDKNPDVVEALVDRLKPGAQAGTVEQALAFGGATLISVPYGALPDLGKKLGSALRGKIVLDTANPSERRDGDMAKEALEKGTGVVSPKYLPGARLVRAFNTVPFRLLQSEAHRPDPKVGIPLAANDAGALAVAKQLVVDAGFEPVVVGGLSTAKSFDTGTAVYAKALTAAEIKRALGLVP